LVVLSPLGYAPPSDAQQESVRPGINRHYQDPDFRQWVETFERPGREVYDRREQILAALELRPGLDVADLGAGTGLFTRLFAPEVAPDGIVYAVDISATFVDNVLRTAREQGLANVRGIVNTDTDSGLAPDSVDLIFVSDTYHHFEYPQRMLTSMHEALRPGGRLAIIDFRKVPGFSSGWVMSHVRADRATVIREIEAEGFRFMGEEDVLRVNYFLWFERE
jgi:predicted methyltransferase